MSTIKVDKKTAAAEAQEEQRKIDLAAGLMAQEIIKVWKNDPELRAEFGGNISNYHAYVAAMSAGRIKIHSGAGLTKARASSILRMDAVLDRTGLSRSSIDRLEDRGEFPPRLQLSDSAVGWLDCDIDNWIATRPR